MDQFLLHHQIDGPRHALHWSTAAIRPEAYEDESGGDRELHQYSARTREGGRRGSVPPRIMQKALPNETVESESIEQEPHWDGSLMPHRVGLALGGYVEKRDVSFRERQRHVERSEV